MSVRTDSQRQMQFLRFYVGRDCYSMGASAVKSIRRWDETTPAPGGFPGAIAAVSLGQATAPVYSLRQLLGLDLPAYPNGPVLLVQAATHTYGVQVDRVARAVAVGLSEPKQLPVAARDPHGRIRGVVRLHDEVSLVLSEGKLPPLPEGVSDFEPEPVFAAPSCWMASPPPRQGNKLLCLSEPSGDSSTTFAFTLRQMIEIAAGLRVIRLGSYNPCVYGLTDWRGYVVPVILPASLTCLPPAPFDFSQSKFAILRGSRSRELFALPAQSFAALTLPFASGAGIGNKLLGLGPYVRAAYEMAGGCLVLPDLDRLVMA